MKLSLLLSVFAIAACAPGEQQPWELDATCKDGIQARARGDYEHNPARAKSHLAACKERCDVGAPGFCLESYLILADTSDDADAVVQIKIKCDDDFKLACAWRDSHREKYDRLLAVADANYERDREARAKRARLQQIEAQTGALHDHGDDPAPSRTAPADDGGTGDPIDRVLAKSDRELRAQGYEVVSTHDSFLAGGAAGFSYDAKLTDRMIQVVCAAHAAFHGGVESSGGTAEFDHVDPGIAGAYVEHFAVPSDVDHARLKFHVVPGWGTSQRLACRVYKK